MSSEASELLQRELQGRTWYRDDVDRAGAEKLLVGREVGCFVVRKSSQEGSVALSFKQENGAIGHNVIVCVRDDARSPPFAFRFSNGKETFDSVKSLLKSLPLLVFDRTIKSARTGVIDKDEESLDKPGPIKAPPRSVSRGVQVNASTSPAATTAAVSSSAPAAKAKETPKGNSSSTVMVTQAKRLLALMPARAALLDKLTLVAVDAAQDDDGDDSAFVERVSGSITVRVFFDTVGVGAMFVTVKISKTATALELCRLVSIKRSFPSLYRAGQLLVVGEGQERVMKDIDRPGPLLVLWAAKRKSAAERAIVFRIRPEITATASDSASPRVSPRAASPPPALPGKRTTDSFAISAPTIDAHAATRAAASFVASVRAASDTTATGDAPRTAPARTSASVAAAAAAAAVGTGGGMMSAPPSLPSKAAPKRTTSASVTNSATSRALPAIVDDDSARDSSPPKYGLMALMRDNAATSTTHAHDVSGVRAPTDYGHFPARATTRAADVSTELDGIDQMFDGLAADLQLDSALLNVDTVPSTSVRSPAAATANATTTSGSSVPWGASGSLTPTHSPRRSEQVHVELFDDTDVAVADDLRFLDEINSEFAGEAQQGSAKITTITDEFELMWADIDQITTGYQ